MVIINGRFRRVAPALYMVILLGNEGFARVTPNSYLDTHAKDVNALLKEVNSNPKVLSRYMRHFAMSKNEITSYFSTLHVKKLDKNTFVPVYGADDKESLRAKYQTLPKGTQVFADVTDKPALKLDCGNPITEGPLRPKNKYVMADNQLLQKIPCAAQNAVCCGIGEGEMPFLKDTIMAPELDYEPGAVLAAASVGSPEGFTPLDDSSPAAPGAPAGEGAGISGGFPFFLFGIFAFGGGGGGGNRTIINRPPNNPPQNPPNVPIPEPITMITFGLGLAGLARKAKQRRTV